MAIKINFTNLNTNHTIQNAHTKIDQIIIDRKSNRTQILLAIYNSPDDTDKQPIEKKVYNVISDDYTTYFSEAELKKSSKSGIERGYAYLKSLSEFATGVDV